VTSLPGCVEDIKHQAILTTCYAAGLRISEAVRLKTSSLDNQRMVIRVAQGKGHKDRYVMLSPKLLDTLRDYWRIVRPKEWLFPGYFGRPITTHACRTARLRAGISKPISPHSTCRRAPSAITRAGERPCCRSRASSRWRVKCWIISASSQKR
jgi:integrase/recombinase XerD